MAQKTRTKVTLEKSQLSQNNARMLVTRDEILTNRETIKAPQTHSFAPIAPSPRQLDWRR